MAHATMETSNDNEVCQHIAIYSQSNLCLCASVCVCVWAEPIAAPVCGLEEQHGDQCALGYSYLQSVRVLETHTGNLKPH